MPRAPKVESRPVKMYIRDLDEQAAREIKARAAREGLTIGQFLSREYRLPRPSGG